MAAIVAIIFLPRLIRGNKLPSFVIGAIAFAIVIASAMLPYFSILPVVYFLHHYFKEKSRAQLIAGIAWLAYGIYEYFIYTRVLCSGDCSIRADLVFIIPVLIYVSVKSLKISSTTN